MSDNQNARFPAPPGLETSSDRVDEARSEVMSPETEWMVSVRNARDREAFARLFDHFAPLVKGFVMRGGTSASLAEVIVQEAMLTVWHKAHLFDPHRGPVSAWIYQIARNKQVDHFRRVKRPIPDALIDETAHEPDAYQLFAIQQETEELKAALDRLSPIQRETIERAFLGEMTHEEISAELGLPLGTTKSRIRLGLERLRHELRGLR